MNGVHDMGGTDGFGPVPVDDAQFHQHCPDEQSGIFSAVPESAVATHLLPVANHCWVG